MAVFGSKTTRRAGSAGSSLPIDMCSLSWLAFASTLQRQRQIWFLQVSKRKCLNTLFIVLYIFLILLPLAPRLVGQWNTKADTPLLWIKAFTVHEAHSWLCQTKWYFCFFLLTGVCSRGTIILLALTVTLRRPLPALTRAAALLASWGSEMWADEGETHCLQIRDCWGCSAPV